MKYHPIFKGIALFLAAVTLIVCASGAAGMLLLENYNLYTETLEDWNYNMQSSLAYSLSYEVLNRYAAETFSNCPPEVLAYLGVLSTDEQISDFFGVDTADWCFYIQDKQGNALGGQAVKDGMQAHTVGLSVNYPMTVAVGETFYEGQNNSYDSQYPVYDDGYAPTELPEAQPDILIDNGYGIAGIDDIFQIDGKEYSIQYVSSPVYTVTIWLTADAAHVYSGYDTQLITLLYAQRYTCIWVFAAGLVLFVLLLIYLSFAAGRSRDGSVLQPAGLNRLPLDLYLVLAGGVIFLLAAGFAVLAEHLWDDFQDRGVIRPGIAALAGTALLIAAVTGMCFLYACIAQGKMKEHFWWRNSIIGRIFCRIGRGFRFVFRALRKLFSLLPLIWQWLLTAVAMALVPGFFLLMMFIFRYDLGMIFSLLCLLCAIAADIALICYGAYAFGLLRKGAQAMSQGDLNHKIPTNYLFGCFRQFADHLNALSEAAKVAAQNEMRSERMKTELITNVSHDIKTPLTSIINFVDLLQKPHTQEEGTQYLEVLDRQSQRLKKLIDDLMDMSKASTGNMRVDTVVLDLTEAVNQALGEFSDKLSEAELHILFTPPEHPVMIRADGRHTWRVLSNLLGNVVKYALPGTRVYLDICRQQNTVQLSVKNISRESLNISAEELTERFVRGDTSRNTEGSGLGLNIAQSLMELQGGSLRLLVDGDLFKVTLTFPASE